MCLVPALHACQCYVAHILIYCWKYSINDTSLVYDTGFNYLPPHSIVIL